VIPAFPLDEIKGNLRKWGCETHDIDGGVEWRNDLGSSEIKVNALSLSTINGRRILGTVFFRHTFDKEVIGLLGSAETVARLNLFASLSAIVPVADSDKFILTSRVTLYAGDEASWSFSHAPMICTEAFVQPAAILLATRPNPPDTRYFGVVDGDAAPPYERNRLPRRKRLLPGKEPRRKLQSLWTYCRVPVGCWLGIKRAVSSWKDFSLHDKHFRKAPLSW